MLPYLEVCLRITRNSESSLLNIVYKVVETMTDETP